MKATAEIVTATKELVDSLIEKDTNNRHKRSTVVARYADDYASGNFLFTNQGIGIDWNGVVVDGGHRLQAIKSAGYPPVQLLIVSGLDPDTRRVVDMHQRRTIADVLRLVLDHDIRAPWVSALRNLMVVATGQNAVKTQDIIDAYIVFETEIKTVFSWPFASKLASPYSAALVLALKKFPEESVAGFAKRFESGELLSKTDPEYLLRQWSQTTIGKAGGFQGSREKLLRAWSALKASASGRSLSKLYAADSWEIRKMLRDLLGRDSKQQPEETRARARPKESAKQKFVGAQA